MVSQLSSPLGRPGQRGPFPQVVKPPPALETREHFSAKPQRSCPVLALDVQKTVFHWREKRVAAQPLALYIDTSSP